MIKIIQIFTNDVILCIVNKKPEGINNNKTKPQTTNQKSKIGRQQNLQ